MSFDKYWSIVIPGASREDMVRARALLLPHIRREISLIYSADLVAAGGDRLSVELDVKCIETALAASVLSDSERVAALDWLKDCREWLEWAAPEES